MLSTFCYINVIHFLLYKFYPLFVIQMLSTFCYINVIHFCYLIYLSIPIHMPVSQEQKQTLQRITDEKLRKMFDDKKQIPKLLIPKQLPSFIKSQTFIKFLQAVFEYCDNFNELLKQYKQLRAKMMNRVSDETSLLQKQKQALAKLQRQVSYNYSAIIISFNSQCLAQERHRSNYKDQVFFEALIYLVERVMKDMFSREDFLLVQEQINRLFRTNRYNLIKKRHQNDEVLHKYPALKDYKNNNNITNILTRAPERIIAYKKYEKDKKNKNKSFHSGSSYQYTDTLGLPKQLTNPDMEQRSPLLCTWLPSKKSMLGDFTQISAYNNYLAAHQQKKSVHQTISSEDDPEVRTRMASIGNNVVYN